MNLEQIPTLENLIGTFDPAIVEEVNRNLGAHAGAIKTTRTDFLNNFEGGGPFEPRAEERTDWLNGFASAARLNLFSRALWHPVRGIHAAIAHGDTLLHNPETGTTERGIDVDRWFKDHESELEGTAGGQRLLKNYLEGDYDGINDAGYFLTLIAYDDVTGAEKEKMSRAHWSASISGSIVDPSIVVGGTAIRLGGGTVLRMRQGATAAKAFQATRATSIAALNGGRLGAYTLENIKIGLGASIYAEIGDRTFGARAGDHDISDTAMNFSLGFVADTLLSGTFFGIGRGVRRAGEGIGLLKPLDIPEMRAKSVEEARAALRTTEDNTGELIDVAAAAAAQQRRQVNAGGPATLEEIINDIDALHLRKRELEAELAEIKSEAADAAKGQGRLFEPVDDTLSGEQLAQVAQQGRDLRQTRAEDELGRINEAIDALGEPLQTRLAEGTVEVTRRQADAEADVAGRIEGEGDVQAPARRVAEDGSEIVAEVEGAQVRRQPAEVLAGAEGMFDRRQFASTEEARANGYVGAGTDEQGFLFDQIGRLGEDEIGDLQRTLADPEIIESLRRVRDAINRSETVQAEDMEGDLLNALNAIVNRSPNLSFNPASLGIGTVQTVKIDQPILHATTVGFVPTTPAEDILLALKQLGAWDNLEGGARGVTPRPGETPPSPGRTGGGGGAGGTGSQRPFNFNRDTGVPNVLAERWSHTRVPRIEEGGDPFGPLALDLDNDRVQAAIRAAREKVGSRIRSSGMERGTDQFSGLGLTAFADEIGSGLGYSASDNRITGSLYNVLFESPFTPKHYTAATVHLPEGLRVPLERTGRSIKEHLDQSELQLTRAFQGFQQKRGLAQRTHVPGLMSVEAREQLSLFYSMIEELRIRGSESPLTDATTLDVIRQPRYFPDAPESALPLVQRAERRLRERLPIGDRGRLNGVEAHALRQNATSLLMNESIDLEHAYRLLRRAHNLDPSETLGFESLTETLELFGRMTDGSNPEISVSDIRAALASPSSTQREYLRNRMVALWNRRLRGVMSNDTAMRLLDDPEFAGQVRLNAVDALHMYRLHALRFEALEKLTDFSLYLRRIEKNRPGQAVDAPTSFDENLHRYGDVVAELSALRTDRPIDNVRQIGPAIAVDKADRLLGDMIDNLTEYAKRNSEQFYRPTSTINEAGRAAFNSKQNAHMRKQADHLNELVKRDLGLTTDIPTETTLRKIGDSVMGLSRATMLSRMGISMLADIPNAATKAISLGMVKHLPRSVWQGLSRTMKNVPVEDRPELMRMLTAWHENAMHNLALGYDLNFTDLNRSLGDAATPKPPAPSGLDRATAFIENPVQRASFLVSGGQWLDNTIRQTGTIQALSELTSANGLIRRLNDVLETLGPDESILDGLKRADLDGNYSAYQHVLRFLTPGDIRFLAEAIEAGRYELVSGASSLTRNSNIRFLSPVDEAADEATRAAQRSSLRSLAALTDSWVEFRMMTAPHTVDRPRARTAPHSLLNRAATQFMSAGMAAGRTVAIQTGNDGLARRAFYVSVAVSSAFAIRAARQYWRGDGDRYEDELEKNLPVMVADAVGWSGVAGVLGDKALSTLAAFAFGDNPAQDSRRSLEFAIQMPVQGYMNRVFAAVSGFRDLVTGEEISDFEKRAMRSVLSAGILDSTLTDGILLGADASGLDETIPTEQILDFIYGDRQD